MSTVSTGAATSVFFPCKQRGGSQALVVVFFCICGEPLIIIIL